VTSTDYQLNNNVALKKTHKSCLTFGGRAFPVAGPTIWNSLPDNVISAPSLSTLRQRLKHFYNGIFSGTIQVSLYQKSKPIWILLNQETVSGSGIS